MAVQKCLLAVCFIVAITGSAEAEFDPQAAFDAHRKLMVGGTWVSTDQDGEQEADRHIASKSKKFVRIVNVFGGTAFVGVYGIAPESGDLTLWSFEDDDDGSIHKWKCTAYEKGKWTWVSEHKEGPVAGTAIVTRINKDEIALKIEGDEPYEKTWKRKR